jgi:hypothetical protein
MAGRRSVVKRTNAFDDCVTALEASFPGVRRSVDDFIEALRIGGPNLATQTFDQGSGRQHVHSVDDPTLGSAGRSKFGITYSEGPPVTGPNSQITHVFVVEDIWLREMR